MLSNRGDTRCPSNSRPNSAKIRLPEMPLTCQHKVELAKGVMNLLKSYPDKFRASIDSQSKRYSITHIDTVLKLKLGKEKLLSIQIFNRSEDGERTFQINLAALPDDGVIADRTFYRLDIHAADQHRDRRVAYFEELRSSGASESRLDRFGFANWGKAGLFEFRSGFVETKLFDEQAVALLSSTTECILPQMELWSSRWDEVCNSSNGLFMKMLADQVSIPTVIDMTKKH